MSLSPVEHRCIWICLIIQESEIFFYIYIYLNFNLRHRYKIKELKV